MVQDPLHNTVQSLCLDESFIMPLMSSYFKRPPKHHTVFKGKQLGSTRTMDSFLATATSPDSSVGENRNWWSLAPMLRRQADNLTVNTVKAIPVYNS